MAAMAYQTCEDIVRGNRTSMTTVKLVLHEAGFFSLGTWNTSLKILNASFFLEVKWRIASPFKIRFVQKTGPGLAIHLGPSQSVEEYLDRRQQSDWGIRSYYDFDEMKGTFQSDIEEKIPYAVWQRADDKVTNDWLRKLPTGEKKMKPQSWDESDMYEKVTIMSRDDWATLLNTYFGNPMPLTFRVLSPDLFSSFAGLPNLVGHDMARPYYRWYMVEVLAGAVYAPWITRRHPDYNSALQHQRRKCFAILETSAGYAFLAPYVRNTFSTEVTDDIVSLLRQVRGAYGKLFARTGNFSKMANLLPSYSTDSGHVLDFLDDATLEERYYHYEAMTTDPLDNWRRLKTGLESSVHGDVTMDAPGDVINHLRFYIPLNPHQDFILRPDVAVLPYFDPRMPPVLKLAGLGSIMAYAMTDAIYAAKYNWTDGERKTWDSSISCIRHWVSSVSDSPEGQLDLLKRTLALATVVLAQQKLAVESESGAIVLKDLPELSGTQLLFVAWCHLECGKKHGLRRCNVPVEDLPSFAEAFKCKEGARMRAFELCTQDLLGT
ncbi:hypothetical protein HPB48_016325 [Haemaphysalis longicornis]|uniref:Peptidase M13 N-terminal domain-containing protein n=1 Tax=Haemaphysalis longicornis TaxID=44386 RepID=A0A9J6GCW1_HAELO|nr:hypothetical protein HPB48_016325 [Haemaphysalis longicornis]